MKYEIKSQADGQSADIHINDFIGDWIDDYWGFGVTSKAFIAELDRLPDSVKTVRLHISTPGGDVVAANHIANTIRDHQASKGRVFEAIVTAAFSAGTIITSACKITRIADNGLMMIHDPWTIALGNAGEMRKQADVLDKFRDSTIAAYQWKSPLSKEELVTMMEAETWMDADDAIKFGFAEEKTEGERAAALFDAGQIAKLPKRLLRAEFIPEKYRARVQALLKPPPAPAPAAAPAPAPAAPTADALAKLQAESEEAIAAAGKRAVDIVALCTAAGVPEAATDFLSKGLSVDEVKAKLADADKIRARCAAAKLPDRANDYIKAGMSVKEVADELFDVLIARQGPEIDNHLGPEHERQDKPKKKNATSQEIYAMRRKHTANGKVN